MRHVRNVSGTLFGLILLTACLSTTPSPTVGPEVGVHIWCQPASCPDGRVLVEIGATAWEATNADGTALVPAETPVEVRILDPDSCKVFAEFSADPHSRFVVEVSTVGPPDVVDTAKEEGIVFPMGPSMGASAPSTCP